MENMFHFLSNKGNANENSRTEFPHIQIGKNVSSASVLPRRPCRGCESEQPLQRRVGAPAATHLTEASGGLQAACFPSHLCVDSFLILCHHKTLFLPPVCRCHSKPHGNSHTEHNEPLNGTLKMNI